MDARNIWNLSKIQLEFELAFWQKEERAYVRPADLWQDAAKIGILSNNICRIAHRIQKLLLVFLHHIVGRLVVGRRSASPSENNSIDTC